MSETWANVAVGAGILLTGVSLVLMTVGLLSYGRLRHGRLLWVSLAFALFVAQGAYLTWLAYGDRGEASGGLGMPALILVDLGIVLALYLAVLKR